MYEHKQLQNLDDYFLNLNDRQEKGVYFYRIASYNEAIKEFIMKMYDTARRNGVVIEGKLMNPDEHNLSYYNEIMGTGFQLSLGFIGESLKKWLPRLDMDQRNSVAVAMYDTLEVLRKNGKNENMLKNAYIKFMCWLYYKFERIANQLGKNQIPKILYEGDISNYELLLFSILSKAGCDIVLLEYHSDAGYRKQDSESKMSILYSCPQATDYPADFSISKLHEQMEQKQKLQRLCENEASLMNCTNAWISGNVFQDILTSPAERGNDPNLFYNTFIQINGVEDKLTYENELYQFQLQLKSNQRKFVIVENMIPAPTNEEVAQIRRGTYTTFDLMLRDLIKNIQCPISPPLQAIMIKSFVETITAEQEREQLNINRIMNKAIILLCWLKRYQQVLFAGYKIPNIACFIYLGGSKNENEAMLLNFLSKLPVDVLILVPERNNAFTFQNRMLFAKDYPDALAVERFPMENTTIRMATAAYQAERELDTIMYQNSGIYRNRQHDKATAVTLTTMYEEISLYWDQEVKYRPNFSVVDGLVNIPVIFAKISGIKDGDVFKYWQTIKTLMTPETMVVTTTPYINPNATNPIKAHVTEFLKNQKIQRNVIKNHPAYKYRYLREEMQDYILDKLSILVEQKLIKGTFVNGTEYTIISTILNLSTDLTRIIQQLDFTKKNPKLIYINTTESMMSLEDSILFAFLNLIGFDIAMFIPTGYQNVENYFSLKLFEEHQLGDYKYDLHLPDFRKISSITRPSWREKIFKRGK